jgi:Domain of unknown function (DUF222)/HNH endonuclease
LLSYLRCTVEHVFDTLDELEVAIEKLAASEAEPDVARLSQLAERLEFQRLRAVAALDRSEAYVAGGALTAAAWLRHRCRMTHGAAAASVSLARKLDLLPEMSEAFAAGDVTRQHARVLADACTGARQNAIVELEPPLVAAARLIDAREFRNLVGYVSDAVDGDGGAATAEAQHDRCYLHVSPLLDGLFAIDGIADGEGAEILLSALDAATGSPRRDSRAAGQRRYDALVGICEAAAPALVTGPGRTHRPHANVTVDIEVLERRGGRPLATRVRAEADHVGRLAAETLRRITCDADIARIVTDGASAPLDVGRRTRVVPLSLWRALVARDGGCVAPGCDRPPGWCDVHHKVHWADGGETNLANCELRCRRHHRAVHEGGPDPPISERRSQSRRTAGMTSVANRSSPSRSNGARIATITQEAPAST